MGEKQTSRFITRTRARHHFWLPDGGLDADRRPSATVLGIGSKAK